MICTTHKPVDGAGAKSNPGGNCQNQDYHDQGLARLIDFLADFSGSRPDFLGNRSDYLGSTLAVVSRALARGPPEAHHWKISQTLITTSGKTVGVSVASIPTLHTFV